MKRLGMILMATGVFGGAASAGPFAISCVPSSP